jgi:hypothetical protein
MSTADELTDALDRVLDAMALIAQVSVPDDRQIDTLILKAQRILHETGNRIQNCLTETLANVIDDDIG